jgi:hypothetical protein
LYFFRFSFSLWNIKLLQVNCYHLDPSSAVVPLSFDMSLAASL